MDPLESQSAPVVALGSLSRGRRATVVELLDGGESLGDAKSSTVARRLLELGFVPGAEIEVIARMWPAYDPIAVRVGGSTFALRRHEANIVRVNPIAESP